MEPSFVGKRKQLPRNSPRCRPKLGLPRRKLPRVPWAKRRLFRHEHEE